MKWMIKFVLLHHMHNVNHVKNKLIKLHVWVQNFVNLLIINVNLYYVDILLMKKHVLLLIDVIGVHKIKFVENNV